jgi:hypothetical protein
MEYVQQPKVDAGSRICISVTRRGVTVYSNPAALRTLAKWLEWIGSQDPKEHFECHVRMDIEDDVSRLTNGDKSNVWVLFERQLYAHFEHHERFSRDENTFLRGFDLTFMATPDEELDEMSKFRETEILPPA